MSVLLPPLTDDESFEKLEASAEDGCSVLAQRLEEGKTVISLTNKEAVWCEESGSYVLNFDGRVSLASIKNFQLVHPRDRTIFCLIHRRVHCRGVWSHWSRPVLS